MGFPVGYSELFLPSLVINAAYSLGLIRGAICWLIRYIGLEGFLEPQITAPFEPSVSAALIRDSLPVVTFGILAEDNIVCAVCLNDMKSDEEVRRLGNCKHIFHRECVDKWVDYDHKTCPLCRSPVLWEGEEDSNREELCLWSLVVAGDPPSLHS